MHGEESVGKTCLDHIPAIHHRIYYSAFYFLALVIHASRKPISLLQLCNRSSLDNRLLGVISIGGTMGMTLATGVEIREVDVHVTEKSFGDAGPEMLGELMEGAPISK